MRVNIPEGGYYLIRKPYLITATVIAKDKDGTTQEFQVKRNMVDYIEILAKGGLNPGHTFTNDKIGKVWLPKSNDLEYYNAYYLKLKSIFSSPERLVIGKNKEIFYTPDHYESFIRVDG